MAAITRRQSEERQNAVLRFFMENPGATGDEAQRALTTGRLTNRKPQPPMGIGMLFKLQRQAKDLAAKGKPPPPPPAPAAVEVAAPTNHAPVPVTGEVVEQLRARAKELAELLQADGTHGVVEIHITRDGTRIVRMTPTEEKL